MFVSTFLLLASSILVIFVVGESNSLTFLPRKHRIKRHSKTRIHRAIPIGMSTSAKYDAAAGNGVETETEAHVSGCGSDSTNVSNSESNRSPCRLPTFPNRIPDERLGAKHDSLEAFQNAVGTTSRPAKKTKEYTLIVVTETLKQQPRKQRILLGLKHRGFGTGKYNSFGGKFLQDENGGKHETVEECACRELEEETNLQISLADMKASKVGIQRFTFADNDKEMLVHLFFIDLAHNSHNKPYEIKGCEEITPRWFENFDDVPLDNMFADDSLWLTALLTKAASTAISTERPLEGPPLAIHGSFYFAEDCEESNTILHYHMDVVIPQATSNSKSI